MKDYINIEKVVCIDFNLSDYELLKIFQVYRLDIDFLNKAVFNTEYYTTFFIDLKKVCPKTVCFEVMGSKENEAFQNKIRIVAFDGVILDKFKDHNIKINDKIKNLSPLPVPNQQEYIKIVEKISQASSNRNDFKDIKRKLKTGMIYIKNDETIEQSIKKCKNGNSKKIKKGRDVIFYG